MLQNMTSQPLSVGLDLSSLRDCAVSFWTVGLRTEFSQPAVTVRVEFWGLRFACLETLRGLVYDMEDRRFWELRVRSRPASVK